MTTLYQRSWPQMNEMPDSLLATDEPPVPVGNLRSEILVVQSAQNWHRQRATDGFRYRGKKRSLCCGVLDYPLAHVIDCDRWPRRQGRVSR
jgi:hypothetical protein